ncbi:MAG: glycogen debranching protein [Cyanobacteria bacterium K_Offshore_surface_m2_239]|nr:glycogen debranching protein [Cyanobacteria bacterium K_Offshore_surface_m2_239]
MVVSFGGEISGERASAESREWLITNGLGSYGCGTVAGSLTRAYHGLLVAALGAPTDPCTRTLLVAALEEVVEVGHRSYPLANHRWSGGEQAPVGHLWIVSFRLEGTVPTWRWALGDALLEKRLWMQPGAHTTTVHYRLLQASQPVRLSLTVLVNARSHHGGTTHPELVQRPVPGGVALAPRLEGVPPFMVCADRGEINVGGAGDWSRGQDLTAEAERGLPSADDHLRAARLTVTLSAETPTLTVVASTEANPLRDGEAALRDRRTHEEALLARWRVAQPRLAPLAPPWVEQLVLAADQFVVARAIAEPMERAAEASRVEAGGSVLAGYPWFGDWGRDTMISLPGLTLVTGRAAIARRILRTYGAFLRHGLLPNRFPEDGEPLEDTAYNTVDATLWYVESLRAYHAASGDDDLIRELFPRLQEIVEAHARGTLHGIRRDPVDGLLRAGEEGLQLTWMDAKVNGEVITPRIGKPVEVNALWINALRAMARFADLAGHASAPYDRLAETARQGFQRFWNSAARCCFDVLDGPDGHHDAALRPNQLLAVTLTEGLLSGEQARAVVRACGQQLLTPLGLRSLDPDHPAYQGTCSGGPAARDRAYHQGTVWGWWLGPYALAHARVYDDPEGALRLLEPIGHHLTTAGLGSVSEIFDGDAPHRPRGCIAQAWSVAEVLRAWVELRQAI